MVPRYVFAVKVMTEVTEPFGDLMITYNVKLPTGLNEKQKELLRQMKEAK